MNSCDVGHKNSRVGVEPLNTSCLFMKVNNLFQGSTAWCRVREIDLRFIPFLIPNDFITRLSSMSTMLAARIFAYVGMQSYSMTVFISGERYSEIGLELI